LAEHTAALLTVRVVEVVAPAVRELALLPLLLQELAEQRLDRLVLLTTAELLAPLAAAQPALLAAELLATELLATELLATELLL
jgi:hypothetical protein